MAEDRYAVIGNPISHNKSRFIHLEFAKQTGDKISFEALQAADDEFESVLKKFIKEGGSGVSVAYPFRMQAYEIVDELSEQAEIAGAVSVIKVCNDGHLYGDNLDGFAFVQDIQENLSFSLDEKRVLLIGSGGMARGLVKPLLSEGIDHLSIANRSLSKAIALADIFADFGPIGACSFDHIQDEKFDLVINATPMSLLGEAPPIPENCLADNGCAYDIWYDEMASTLFVNWGLLNGAALVSDGLGMLVEHAAEAYCLWRDVKPDTTPLLQMLA